MMAGICGEDVVLFAGMAAEVLVPAEHADGAFSLLRLRVPSGCWTPAHLHRNEDETVFVLSGTVRAETEAGSIDLLPGRAMTLPRGRAHRIGNAGSVEARLLVLCTPGGFDRLVCAAGRPAVGEEDWAMSQADLNRLMREAPRHGVELLASWAVKAGGGAASARAEPPTLDVFGVGLQFPVELGTDEDDVSLMWGRLPPDVVVPLHGHADREVLYVLDGTLDISLGPLGRASWRTVGRGSFVDVAPGIPHALRNRGDGPVDIVLVATRRIATLFRELGRPQGEVPTGPPSPDRLAAFARASQARGYWLGDRQENAAIGLVLA